MRGGSHPHELLSDGDLGANNSIGAGRIHLVNELVEALILLDDCREGSHSIGRKAVVSIHERALTGRLGLDLHEI